MFILNKQSLLLRTNPISVCFFMWASDILSLQNSIDRYNSRTFHLYNKVYIVYVYKYTAAATAGIDPVTASVL